MNKKGFAISGIIYSLLILFLLLLFGILSIMGARKMILDKLKNEVMEELNGESLEPSLPDSVSFAEDSWETISAIVKAGKAEETYNVGDTKEVTLTGTYAGTYTVRIANNSTPTECSTEGFSQTACGFVVEFVDIITTHKIGDLNIGGWPASEIYSFINDDIYDTLPSELKKIIVATYSVSSHGFVDASNFTSNDKLYLLSAKEVWGSNPGNFDSGANSTRQLDYYKNNNVTTSNFGETIKNYQGSAKDWWLRTANLDDEVCFFRVNVSGNWINNSANGFFGVSPAFRI